MKLKSWVELSDRRYEVTDLRRPLLMVALLLTFAFLAPAQAQVIGPPAGGGGQCATSTWAALPASPPTNTCFSIPDAGSCTAGTQVTTSGSTPCQLTWCVSGWFPAGCATATGSGGLTTANGGLQAIGSTVSLISPVAVVNGGTGASAAGATAAGNIGALAVSNNLSDVPIPATARSNLGLGTAAVVNTPIPVVNGGTGTGTAGPTAAHNIGAAAEGANSDITSLTGLTTPLSVAQGGTGTGSPGLVAGSNVTVTGSWPNQTIASSGGGAPGGSAGQIQFNNSGAFGGVSQVPVANGGTQCGAPSLFTSLPGSPTNGMQCVITDAPDCKPGKPITVGGGSFNCPAQYNGTNWLPSAGGQPVGVDYVINFGASPGDINCPAGVDTLIDSGTITVPYTGVYKMIFRGWVPTQTGATAPSQIDYKIKLTSNGSDVFSPGDTQPPPYLLFPNNTWEQHEINTVEQTSLDPTGFAEMVKLIAGEIYTPAMYVNPTGQPVTVLLGGFHEIIFHSSAGWSTTSAQTGGLIYNQ